MSDCRLNIVHWAVLRHQHPLVLAAAIDSCQQCATAGTTGPVQLEHRSIHTGATPLHLAASTGQAVLAHLLLQQGAHDPGKVPASYVSPHHQAANTCLYLLFP